MFAFLGAWRLRLKCLAVENQEKPICQICACTTPLKGQVVKCTMKNLTQVPSSFPVSTRHLYLDKNSLKGISGEAFWNLQNLIFL
ncbi:unnamed protein product [Porites lobata]|uniref:LRRNT domain-containing protein n=1 Tax=Porites lobata TaxID=104759 RepID=A0ABN8PA42_9CNID|nr:unnamed protein product [Porites lobata]